MPVTFIHTFPKTQVSPAYEALAVRHGLNTYPVSVFEGRQCYVFNSFRCFGGKGRGYHNKVQIKFLDNDEIRIVPGGEFAKESEIAMTEAQKIMDRLLREFFRNQSEKPK